MKNGKYVVWANPVPCETYFYAAVPSTNDLLTDDSIFRRHTVREALIRDKGYRDEQLPCRQTIGSILKSHERFPA